MKQSVTIAILLWLLGGVILAWILQGISEGLATLLGFAYFGFLFWLIDRVERYYGD